VRLLCWVLPLTSHLTEESIAEERVCHKVPEEFQKMGICGDEL
jgi:hypothetical protein